MVIQEIISKLQHYFDTNNYKTAESFLNDIIKSGENPECISLAHYLTGRIHFYRSNYAEAKKAFINALKYKKDDKFIQFFLARTLHLMGEEDDALKLYAQCCIDNSYASLVSTFINEFIFRESFKDNSLNQLAIQPEKIQQPVVSIIVLCYNKMEYTEKCLESIFANTCYPPYEVIVVDNASSDNTPALLEMYSKKIKFIHSDTNLGFVNGNNMAVEHAAGDYIVFLNNDTEVQENWLKEMYDCFEIHSHVGAVGSMLIYPDSKLQEAGGIIFSDASGWNYGRRESANNPRYLFVREVDYCSGASLMVKKDLFLKLGGFDRRFAPAYYEDTDICFGLRKLGYKVLYCPTSKVIHHEGITAGTELDSGLKKYQVINKTKFLKKWQKELRHQYPHTPGLDYQSSNRKAGKRILIIDDWPPLPDKASGCKKMYHTLKQMIELGYQITYVHLTGKNLGENSEKYFKEFRTAGVEFIWFNYEAWWGIRETPAVKPHLEKLIESLELKKRKYDFIYICFWFVANYFVDYIRKSDSSVPILIDSVDIHYLREIRQADVLNNKLLKEKALKNKVKELEVYSKADCITTVTKADMDFLRKDLPRKPVFLVTNVHNPINTENDFDHRRDLLFVGNFNHPPNEDGVLYFAEDIFPLIKREVPDVKFFIVGNNPTPKIKALSSDDIIVTGWVPEVKPYYEQCRVCVIPLRFGAGMKGKVGEALSYGLPMVSTSVGTEGMNIINETHAFVTDDPKSFAEKAVRLYKEKETWEKFSNSGKELLSDLCTSEMMRKRIEYITSYKTRKSLTSYRALNYPTPPVVSIIVISANNPHLTRKCLDSIRKNIAVSHETFAISKDRYDNLAVLQNDYPELRISDDIECSYPGSANRAISNALGGYIVLVRDTVEFADDYINKMIARAEQSHDLGLITASDSYECLLMKRYVINKIGGIDERFAPGGLYEDVDFILRALAAGFRLEEIEDPLICNKLDAQLSDEKIFMDKWGFSPSVALKQDFADVFNKREIMFPINRDIFIENFERALISSREGETLNAFLFFERAIKAFHISKRNGYSIELPELLNMAGEEAIKLNETDKADKFFNEALNLTPYYRDVVINYGKLLLKTNRLHKASRIFNTFLSHYPDDKEIRQLLEESEADLQKTHDYMLMVEDEEEDILEDASEITVPLTSIIILTHNQLEDTKACLESIRKFTSEPYEIIVVDNGSKDGTVDYLKEQVSKFKDIWVIQNNSNRGFAAGCNQGISVAEGEYILLLNNDTIVTPGWLGRMLDVFRRHPEIGIVGPMSNYVSGQQLISDAGYDNIDELDAFAVRWAKEHDAQSFPIYRVVGFCLLTKKEVIQKIGGLDEQFGSGNFEDDDFCIRASLSGYEARVAEDVYIHHTGSRTFIGAGIDYKKSLLSNWELFKAKWGIPLNTPYDKGYNVPLQPLPRLNVYIPLPDVSIDHQAHENRRWLEEAGGWPVTKKRISGLTSIIVLTSDQFAHTKKCVKSLRRNTHERHEIIAVDNGSSQKTTDWLRKQANENRDIKLIGNPPSPPLKKGGKEKETLAIEGNEKEAFEKKTRVTEVLEKEGALSETMGMSGGYVKACNQGIGESSGEYIAVLTDSVVVSKGWLQGLLECLNASPDAGVIGPMTTNVEGLQNVIKTDYGSPDDLEGFAGAFREKYRYRRVPSMYLAGCCMLFRHELLKKTGLFDESSDFSDFADNDFCFRAALEGYRNIIAADVFIHHYADMISPGRKEDAAALSLKKRDLFIRKWSKADKETNLKLSSLNALQTADEMSQAGMPEKAIGALIGAIKSDTDDKRLYYALAEVLMENTKFTEAQGILQNLPEKIRQELRWLELAAKCSAAMQSYREAEEYADKALAVNNASAAALNIKGLVSLSKGLNAEAGKFFEMAMKTDRGFAEAYANIGRIKWPSNKDAAFSLFEKAFILAPIHSDVATQYYNAVVSLSRFKRAEAVFRDAVALYPMNRKLRFFFNDMLIRTGKRGEVMEIKEADIES